MSEAFWTWFSGESERLFHALDDSPVAVMEEVNAVLERDHPGVFCELPGKPEGAARAQMVITPDGDADLIGAVKELVETAPELERWSFIPFRQRDLAGGGSITMDGVSLAESDVFYRTYSGPQGELYITLVIRGLTEDEGDKRPLMAALLMDHLIGELDSLTTIASLDRDVFKDENEEGLRPLATLPQTIEDYKDVGLDNWEVYRTEIDEEGTAAFVTVKLGLGIVAPLAHRPVQVRVIVPFVTPREDGLLSDQEEVALLWQIEDELREALAESCDAIPVARVNTSGIRDYVFYAPADQMVEAHAQRVFAAYPQYEIDVRVEEDPNWEFYFEFLLPSPFERLRTDIERRLDALEDAGDDLDLPREILWLLVFRDAEGCAAYLSDLPEAFRVVERDEDGRGVTLARTSPARASEVGPILHDLFARFAEIPGFVDQWRCPPANGA